MTKEIALLITGAIMPLGIWLCVLHSRFLRILRSSHAGRWISMGRPQPAFTRSIAAEISLTRLLLTGGYRAFDDPKLALVGDDLRQAHLVLLSCIITSALLFAVSTLY